MDGGWLPGSWEPVFQPGRYVIYTVHGLNVCAHPPIAKTPRVAAFGDGASEEVTPGRVGTLIQ